MEPIEKTPQIKETEKLAELQPLVLNPKQASLYLGISTKSDALKIARATGTLWGHLAPKFRKVGARKVLYLKSDLDDFIAQFPAYQNNAEVSA